MTLELSPAESRAIRAALGEVCFGFRVENFEATIGCTKDQARGLFDRLNVLDLDQQNTINIGQKDLYVVRNAHTETLRRLGAEEYTTRTGVEISEGRSLLEQIEKVLV